METNYIFLAFSFAAMTLVSCNDEVDGILDIQDEQIKSKDSVFTYDMYFNSEITSYDGTTRATTASDWENGDVVYLQFLGNNDVCGRAEYISSSKKWRVTCEKALAESSNAICYVWCGNGVNPREEGDNVYYKYMTEAYFTLSGKYTCVNNGVYVNATMKPRGWRLRLKGTVGTNISIWGSSVNFYGVMSKTSIVAGVSCNIIDLTVNSDGYTDYFIGSTNNSNLSITILNDAKGEAYSRYFDSNTLKEGESGCFTIPTSSNLRGWTMLTSDFKQSVNLGLPSGTKWAKCNIGASTPEEYGGYYAWGETEGKFGYMWETYIHCDGTNESCHSIGNDIAGTQYDVAYVKWGGTWRLPSKDQYKELIDNCIMTLTTQNGVYGLLVTGPNGNSIFLPAAGERSAFTIGNRGNTGYYLSSSLFLDNQSRVYTLHFSSYNFLCDNDYRCSGLSVRAVCP